MTDANKRSKDFATTNGRSIERVRTKKVKVLGIPFYERRIEESLYLIENKETIFRPRRPDHGPFWTLLMLLIRSLFELVQSSLHFAHEGLEIGIKTIAALAQNSRKGTIVITAVCVVAITLVLTIYWLGIDKTLTIVFFRHS